MRIQGSKTHLYTFFLIRVHNISHVPRTSTNRPPNIYKNSKKMWIIPEQAIVTDERKAPARYTPWHANVSSTIKLSSVTITWKYIKGQASAWGSHYCRVWDGQIYAALPTCREVVPYFKSTTSMLQWINLTIVPRFTLLYFWSVQSNSILVDCKLFRFMTLHIDTSNHCVAKSPLKLLGVFP